MVRGVSLSACALCLTCALNAGGNIQPKRDLSRQLRWPKYIRLQRQRKVLQSRLKIPPSINQFTQTVDKNTATEVFRIFNKYRPEDKAAKKLRLKALAEKKVRLFESAPASIIALFLLHFSFRSRSRVSLSVPLFMLLCLCQFMWIRSTLCSAVGCHQG